MDLTTATPAEIDTVLAEIWERQSDAMFEGSITRKDIKVCETRLAKAVEANHVWNIKTYEDSLKRLQERLAEKNATFAACVVEAAPFNAEFDRRGGWTRAYKVLNSNGHIHRSTECSTCFPTTRFGWLPQVSGLDESEIVDLAGEGACTVCYPTAPAIGPNTLYTLVEAAERAARAAERQARAAEKAAKLEAKVAKSLSLDGSVVTVRWTYEDTNWRTKEPMTSNASKDMKTYRSAELFVVDSLAAVGCKVDYSRPPVEVIEQVLAMMAEKKGSTVEEIRKPLQAKADKKRAAESWRY